MATTTVPTSTPAEQPTRRGLLGTLAVGLLGGSAAAAATPLALADGIDPHGDWWQQSILLRTRIDTESLTDEACDALADEMHTLDDLIAATPAATLAGVCAQLRLAHYCAETWKGDRNEPVEAALQRAIATLERLAGRAPA